MPKINKNEVTLAFRRRFGHDWWEHRLLREFGLTGRQINALYQNERIGVSEKSRQLFNVYLYAEEQHRPTLFKMIQARYAKPRRAAPG